MHIRGFREHAVGTVVNRLGPVVTVYRCNLIYMFVSYQHSIHSGGFKICRKLVFQFRKLQRLVDHRIVYLLKNGNNIVKGFIGNHHHFNFRIIIVQVFQDGGILDALKAHHCFIEGGECLTHVMDSSVE